MEGRTIRILSEYIAELHRRDRERNRASGYSSIYTEAEQDTNGVQRDYGGDDGCDQDSSGQGGDNLSR